MRMKTKMGTGKILKVMHILSWVAFIGLMIEAGAILISYFLSWSNPEAARNLYTGLNLYNLRQFSFWHYSMSVSFLVALSSMKAFVLFLVIKTLSKVNLMNPFTIEVARTIESISYVLLGTWIVAILNNAHARWLMKRMGDMEGVLASREFIFMAGLLFIISQIFKRGVEMQSENDLTV